ncbi:hypothetical protein P9112_011075 [Eukaryota sp. TZLM1-RC]
MPVRRTSYFVPSSEPHNKQPRSILPPSDVESAIDESPSLCPIPSSEPTFDSFFQMVVNVESTKNVQKTQDFGRRNIEKSSISWGFCPVSLCVSHQNSNQIYGDPLSADVENLVQNSDDPLSADVEILDQNLDDPLSTDVENLVQNLDDPVSTDVENLVQNSICKIVERESSVALSRSAPELNRSLSGLG